MFEWVILYNCWRNLRPEFNWGPCRGWNSAILTVQVLGLAGFPSVLLGQHVLRDELEQGLHVGVDVYPVSDFLLKERFGEVDDCVY